MPQQAEAPCCAQAWSKATNKRISPHVKGGWYYKRGRAFEAVPAPDSAEWLADIVEATDHIQITAVGNGYNLFDVDMEIRGKALHGNGSDKRRALCAAFSGKPCERNPYVQAG